MTPNGTAPAGRPKRGTKANAALVFQFRSSISREWLEEGDLLVSQDGFVGRNLGGRVE
jgi:hypothetical protein